MSDITPQPPEDPYLYAGYDYPRDGCRLEIQVGPEPGGRVILRTYDPTGRGLESYGPGTPDAAAIIVLSWLRREAPPRYLHKYRVQVSRQSGCTE